MKRPAVMVSAILLLLLASVAAFLVLLFSAGIDAKALAARQAAVIAAAEALIGGAQGAEREPLLAIIAQGRVLRVATFTDSKAMDILAQDRQLGPIRTSVQLALPWSEIVVAYVSTEHSTSYRRILRYRSGRLRASSGKDYEIIFLAPE